MRGVSYECVSSRSPAQCTDCHVTCLCVFQFHMVIPIIFLVCCTFLLVFPLYKAPYDTGMALICVLSGIPVYLIGVSWKKKPKSFNRLVSKSHMPPSV